MWSSTLAIWFNDLTRSLSVATKQITQYVIILKYRFLGTKFVALCLDLGLYTCTPVSMRYRCSSISVDKKSINRSENEVYLAPTERLDYNHKSPPPRYAIRSNGDVTSQARGARVPSESRHVTSLAGFECQDLVWINVFLYISWRWCCLFVVCCGVFRVLQARHRLFYDFFLSIAQAYIVNWWRAVSSKSDQVRTCRGRYTSLLCGLLLDNRFTIVCIGLCPSLLFSLA